MRLSNAKINHIAHIVADHLTTDRSVKCLRDQNDIRLRVKLIITDELKLDEDVDRFARREIKNMAKKPPEGSKEWEVLYERHYEEELNRRRSAKADGIRRMR